MAFVRVGSASKLPADSMFEYRMGEWQVAVCNAGGDFYAVDSVCPHRGGPLAQGALHGTTIVCPWHAWEFDCITGLCDFNPEIQLKRYTIKVEGDDLLVDI